MVDKVLHFSTPIPAAIRAAAGEDQEAALLATLTIKAIQQAQITVARMIVGGYGRKLCPDDVPMVARAGVEGWASEILRIVSDQSYSEALRSRAVLVYMTSRPTIEANAEELARELCG